MTTKYVDYCMHTKLACSYAANKNVVLCLQDEALVAPIECPEDAGTYVGAFIDAEICQAFTLSNPCQTPLWQYRFSYDDTQLADPSTPLATADIAGVFCEDCHTDWVKYLVGSEPYIRDNGDGTWTFVSPHGCEYTFGS